MATPNPDRVRWGRVGALESWSRTPNRTARTASARASSPDQIDYWIGKLDPELFADASDSDRLAAAQAAQRAHFMRMAQLSAQARRRGGDAR